MKRKMKKFVLLLSTPLIAGLALKTHAVFSAAETIAVQPTTTLIASSESELLAVPLESQYEGIALGNGCEVTALSMLLQYYGYQTNKNQLAALLDYVPVYVTEQLHGNPHDGFVGNIYGGLDAMGVAVEPIAAVAEEIVGQDYQVMSSELSFQQLTALVTQGTPVWVITTVDFQIPDSSDFKWWTTTSGTVEVSPLCHAAVITGMTADTVYVNDPHGYQNRAVAKADFQMIYEAMGSQALYLRK